MTGTARLCRCIMFALSFIQRPVCTGERSLRRCITLGFLPDLTRADKRRNSLLRIILARFSQDRPQSASPEAFPKKEPGSKIPEQVNDSSAIRKLGLSSRKISALRNGCS